MRQTMNRKRNVNRKSNTSTKRKYKQKKTKRHDKKNKKTRRRRHGLRGGYFNNAVTSMKNFATNAGIRNITNVEEIKDCVINDKQTPRLSLIMDRMKTHYYEIYKYFMPMDGDLEGKKQEKCMKLNKIREDWIIYKQKEIGEFKLLSDNKKDIKEDMNLSRGIIDKTFGLPTNSTRYLYFLMYKYCQTITDNEDMPGYCLQHFQTLLGFDE